MGSGSGWSKRHGLSSQACMHAAPARAQSTHRLESPAAINRASCLRRIVHFDLKSANVLLGRDWTAKIADVGLAKILKDGWLSTLREVCILILAHTCC